MDPASGFAAEQFAHIFEDASARMLELHIDNLLDPLRFATIGFTREDKLEFARRRA